METVRQNLKAPKFWLYTSLMLFTILIVCYHRLGIALKVVLPFSLLFIIGNLIDFPKALGLTVITASIMSVMLVESHLFLHYWFRLSLADILVFVQVLFLIVYGTIYKDQHMVQDDFSLPMILYIIGAVVSILVATNMLASVAYIALLVIGYIFYRYITFVFQSRGDLELLTGTAVLALALVVVWAFFNESTASSEMRAGIYLASRAGFVFAGPNGLAGVIVLLLPFTFMAFYVRNVFAKIGMAIIFVAAIYLLSRTFSRNGYLCFLVSTLVMVVLFVRTRGKSVLFSSVLILAINVPILFLGSAFFIRLFSVTMFQLDPSSLFRLVMWKSALNEFVAHPLTGIGIANFYYATRLLRIGFCHNLYLNSFAETGLLGGVAVLLLLGMVFTKLLTTFRKLGSGFLKHLNICLIGSWVAFSLNNMFDQIGFFIDRTAEMKFFWFLLAITAVFLKVAKGRYHKSI